jgi:mono/diheme cytochrome c family protein
VTKPIPVLFFVGLALVALPGAACAQNASYTVEQAAAGAQAFQASCTVCHAADLSGGEGPPLTGAAFADSWSGQSVGSLLGFLKENMPLTAPGSLSEETYLTLIAYLLSMNGVPAGAAPLAAAAPDLLVIKAP